MSFKYIIIFVLLTNIYAIESINTPTYIDKIHTKISNQVSYLSEYIDIQLSGNDENLSHKVTEKKTLDSIDSFFQTKKFTDATDKTFARVRLGSLIQSRDNHDFIYKLRAHVPLSRTKKRYNLFIEDITQDDIESTSLKDENDEDTSLKVGINYFAPRTYGIESKYSLGTSGLNPFLRARYYVKFKSKKWRIEPVQILKYSARNKFEETTSIYVDTVLSRSKLFRYVISRGTKEEEEGMNYTTSFTYFNILSTKTAISMSQSFSGNTQYQENIYDRIEKTRKFKGINNYATLLNIRQNTWKKWFFYEVTPGINFHRDYQYKANYSLRFTIDIYFGKVYQ